MASLDDLLVHDPSQGNAPSVEGLEARADRREERKFLRFVPGDEPGRTVARVRLPLVGAREIVFSRADAEQFMQLDKDQQRAIVERGVNQVFQPARERLAETYGGMSALQKIATGTMAMPVAGDVAGLLADAEMYWNDPSSRTWTNAGLTLAGIAPVIPAASVARKFGRQTDLATRHGLDSQALARGYPQPGDPIVKPKEKGGTFLSKNNSPEELSLQKARAEARADIKAGNYEPHFPVEERYYADPAGYDMQGNTLVDAQYKTPAKAAEQLEMWDTDEVRQNLRNAYEAGLSPESQDWYAMGQLESAFIDELGEVEGRKMFRKRFAEAMSSTTGGADPTANLLMANYANYLDANNMDWPAGSYEMPHPIGGEYAGGNMRFAKKVHDNPDLMTTAGHPKRSNFTYNFLGDTSRATIDKQMSGLYGVDAKGKALAAPPGNNYANFETILGEVAKEYGVDPSNFQEVAWAGAKGVDGKPMIQHVNEAIERTSRVTGMTPDEVVRKSLIRAEAPLYGIGAAGVLGGAAALQQLDKEDDPGSI